MEFEYVTPNNLWSVYKQDGIVSTFYAIYRYYDEEGWMPYRQMRTSLVECFMWFRQNNIISADEMKENISLLTDKKE